MQDEQKLDKVLERFYNRYNKYNTQVLQTLGDVVKQFDGLTPSQAHELAQQLKIGYDVNSLMLELSKISGKAVQDISKLFDRVAKENVEFAEVYYKARNEEYVKYEDNEGLQNLVESIKKQTDGLFTNLANSNNIGFSMKDNQGNVTYKPLANVYNDLIDEAVYNVSTGVIDYQSAMRNTIRQLADSGIKVHEEKLGYKNGYNRRIDSSVRQDILTGLRQINLGIQEEIGKKLDTNGVEISAHLLCAEDHLDIQGQQYSNEEFEKINSELMRPIGEYNCRHFVFSVILGVQEPNYTKKQLDEMRENSLSKVKYKGNTYTKYEATQVQRKFELVIRKQKDRQIIAKASGDVHGVDIAQRKITQLTKEYNEFSKAAGLLTYKNRLSVSGYQRTSVKITNELNINIKEGSKLYKQIEETKQIYHATNNLKEIYESNYITGNLAVQEKGQRTINYGFEGAFLKPTSLNSSVELYNNDRGNDNTGNATEKFKTTNIKEFVSLAGKEHKNSTAVVENMPFIENVTAIKTYIESDNYEFWKKISKKYNIPLKVYKLGFKPNIIKKEINYSNKKNKL